MSALDPHVSALVIHDLKNRLAEQGAMLATLATDTPDLADRIETLRRHGEDLQRRLVAFLALYRLDTDGGRNRPDDASPARLLRAIATQPHPAHTGIVVEIDDTGCPASWILDDYLVGLALEAALDNALRHARSTVRLSAVRDGDWLAFVIEDDGPGPDAGGRPGASGVATGMGTALCRRVAELHAGAAGRGSVSLSVRSPGPGACFAMRLPA